MEKFRALKIVCLLIGLTDCAQLHYKARWLNLAYGKNTKRSSAKWASYNAVDGNRNPNGIYGQSCWESYWHDNKPWWMVILGGQVYVHHVRVTNRGDCCSDRLTGVTVGVTNTDPVSGWEDHLEQIRPCDTLTYHVLGGKSWHVTCDMMASRVILYKARAFIDACEVEVFGNHNREVVFDQLESATTSAMPLSLPPQTTAPGRWESGMVFRMLRECMVRGCDEMSVDSQSNTVTFKRYP